MDAGLISPVLGALFACAVVLRAWRGASDMKATRRRGQKIKMMCLKCHLNFITNVDNMPALNLHCHNCNHTVSGSRMLENITRYVEVGSSYLAYLQAAMEEE